MNFDERYAFFEKTKGAEAGGWFDAVSPDINDTYPLHGLKVWLSNAGFVDVERTMDDPNHHLIARKAASLRRQEQPVNSRICPTQRGYCLGVG